MSRSEDPLGRRSLFSGPGEGDIDPGDDGAAGRQALWSRPATPSRLGVVVDCSRCRRRRVLDPLTAARHVLPSLWWPLHRPSRYLSCPACGHWSWCRVRPAGLGDR